ncbi:MAG: sporulation protein [Clostridia bacterium]|nr:sporulation protein [Clostridia bacterium]
MSFFDKAMASIGIGSAKVDARLDNPNVRVGDQVSGIVHITGGKISQQIDKIYIELKTYYIRETNDTKVKENVTIMKHEIPACFMLNPREVRQIPFAFPIPFETPFLAPNTVWLQTGLDIKMALDPSDKDYLNVLPHPFVDTIFAVLGNMGFRANKIENLYNKHYGRRVPFIQEFEFKPAGEYRYHLDELECVFYADYNGVEILMEIDRRARGLSGFLMESMNMDESHVRLNIPAHAFQEGPYAIENYIRGVIGQYL